MNKFAYFEICVFRSVLYAQVFLIEKNYTETSFITSSYMHLI